MPSRSKEFLTASEASSSASGPSDAVTVATEAKRPRKRNRNKKRTAEVDSDSDNNSNAVESKSVVPTLATAVIASDKAGKSGKADESPNEDEASGKNDDAEGKRKRKRKRSTKKKGEIDDAGSSAKPVAVGPDPETDLRLSEQAKQAILYAQTYTADKAQWKFNKARQNWLLRNALSVPPVDYDACLARRDPGSKVEEIANGDDRDEEGETFIPDDFVPVVAVYLKSVLGGAKLRLIQTLNEALNAAEVTSPTSVQTLSAADKPAGPEVSMRGKSVSFADMAMEQEGTQENSNTTALEANGESVAPIGPDSKTVELKRQRARFVLQEMGEVV